MTKTADKGVNVDLDIGQIPIIGDVEAALNLAEGGRVCKNCQYTKSDGH